MAGRAETEDSWQPAGRANDASMMLAIPEPHSVTRVEMRYNPPLRRLGFMVSGLSLAMLLLSATRFNKVIT
jgi:hypothetical protein